MTVGLDYHSQHSHIWSNQPLQLALLTRTLVQTTQPTTYWTISQAYGRQYAPNSTLFHFNISLIYLLFAIPTLLPSFRLLQCLTKLTTSALNNFSSFLSSFLLSHLEPSSNASSILLLKCLFLKWNIKNSILQLKTLQWFFTVFWLKFRSFTKTRKYFKIWLLPLSSASLLLHLHTSLSPLIQNYLQFLEHCVLSFASVRLSVSSVLFLLPARPCSASVSSSGSFSLAA